MAVAVVHLAVWTMHNTLIAAEKLENIGLSRHVVFSIMLFVKIGMNGFPIPVSAKSVL